MNKIYIPTNVYEITAMIVAAAFAKIGKVGLTQEQLVNEVAYAKAALTDNGKRIDQTAYVRGNHVGKVVPMSRKDKMMMVTLINRTIEAKYNNYLIETKGEC